jgi:hypothetical protein
MPIGGRRCALIWLRVSSRRAAGLAVVAFLLCMLPATAQVHEGDDGKFTVVPYGGSSTFSDPPRYGIYCASAPLLQAADPTRGYPAWQASAAFRNMMEVWRENPHLPRGRGPNDFVLYLNVGTTFHVVAAPETSGPQNPHYQITIDSGPSAGRTCWTNYD